MRRWTVVLVCVLFLVGCTSGEAALDPGLRLRQRLLDSGGCAFRTTVTADYGDYLHTFVLSCQGDSTGELRFEVVAPDTISGITGVIRGEQGKLTFDEEVLVFSPLVDGLLSPVSAPWSPAGKRIRVLY